MGNSLQLLLVSLENKFVFTLQEDRQGFSHFEEKTLWYTEFCPKYENDYFNVHRKCFSKYARV